MKNYIMVNNFINLLNNNLTKVDEYYNGFNIQEVEKDVSFEEEWATDKEDFEFFGGTITENIVDSDGHKRKTIHTIENLNFAIGVFVQNDNNLEMNIYVSKEKIYSYKEQKDIIKKIYDYIQITEKDWKQYVCSQFEIK